MSLSNQNSPPTQGCFGRSSFLPGRMKTFSTDNMAAMGSSRSSQSREAAFMTAQARLGGRGNCTRNSPSLVTWPLLVPGKEMQVQHPTKLCLSVNQNRYTRCQPPQADKKYERGISLWIVLTLQAQTGAGDMKQVSPAEECFTFLQFAYACFMTAKPSSKCIRCLILKMFFGFGFVDLVLWFVWVCFPPPPTSRIIPGSLG